MTKSLSGDTRELATRAKVGRLEIDANVTPIDESARTTYCATRLRGVGMSDRMVLAYALIALVALTLIAVWVRLASQRRKNRAKSQKIDIRIKD